MLRLISKVSIREFFSGDDYLKNWRCLADFFGAAKYKTIEDLTEYLETKGRFDEEAIYACKCFLKQLIKMEKRLRGVYNNTPLWKGLLKMKDRNMFMTKFILLLPHMWV